MLIYRRFARALRAMKSSNALYELSMANKVLIPAKELTSVIAALKSEKKNAAKSRMMAANSSTAASSGNMNTPQQ